MKQRLQIILAVGFLAVLLALGLGLGGQTIRNVFRDRQALEAWLAELGPWAPLAIIVAQILQVLLAPIPGQIVGLAAGYLYGIWWGTALCMAGLMIGTATAIWLARRLGRPLVERLAPPALIARVDGYSQRRGSVALLAIFLFPFLPDDIICFVAGLTSLRLGRLLLLAFVGRLPGVWASCWIGSQAQNLSWTQIGLMILIMAPLVFLFAKYQEKIESWMFALVERLFMRR